MFTLREQRKFLNVAIPSSPAPASPVPGKLRLYIHLVRLDKPIGILLLLWPTLIALWVAAAGRPSPLHVFIFVAGTVLMRSAGCAINDVADRKFDLHVERTRARPITSGAVSAREGVAVAVGLALVSFLLVLPLNKLTWALAVAAVVIAATYPLFKRFFALPQAYLGIAFGFGIPMGFAAVQDTVPVTGWIMLAGNVCWALAYDTEYAMVDRDDDLRIGIRTAAITFGRFDVAAVMLCYVLTLLLFGWAGLREGLGAWFIAGLAGAAGIAGYHYRLIRNRERAGCFRAFLHNNWFGAVMFAGVVLDYALR